MDLRRLGYCSFYEEQVAKLATQPRHQGQRKPGRISRVDGVTAQILTEDRPEDQHTTVAVPARIRRAEELRPVVGDWIIFDPDHPGQPTISAVLRRKTQISRVAAGIRTELQVLAANVDIVFIVMGLDGDFSPHRIERYIATAADGGARPVVLLTKAGACTEVETRLADLRLATQNIDLHAIDVVTGIGAQIPQQYAKEAATIALLGSSGAGKSTLVNHLMGREVMPVGSVREDDQRGRHTTTHRQLLVLPKGGVIIDNPGIRELSLWLAGDGLNRAFSDVATIARECRFGDCFHRREPGCAVRLAVEHGQLDAGRLERFLRLRDEIGQTQLRRDELSRRTTDKARGKFNRAAIREGQRRKGG